MMPITMRGKAIDWDSLCCCKDCFVAYTYYLLHGTRLYQRTPTPAIRAPPAVPLPRNSPLRDYDHIVLNEQPIDPSTDISLIAAFERDGDATYIHRDRRQIPLEYIEVNGRPCLQLSSGYIEYIGHPRHVLWFPPHVRLEGGIFAVQLPEWSTAPLGPFLNVKEVFELARRKARLRERRRFVVLLVGLPALAMICFAIFVVGWFRKYS